MAFLQSTWPKTAPWQLLLNRKSLLRPKTTVSGLGKLPSSTTSQFSSSFTSMPYDLFVSQHLVRKHWESKSWGKQFLEKSFSYMLRILFFVCKTEISLKVELWYYSNPFLGNKRNWSNSVKYYWDMLNVKECREQHAALQGWRSQHLKHFFIQLKNIKEITNAAHPQFKRQPLSKQVYYDS